METQNKVVRYIATHRRGIIYWVATLWLGLAMVSTGLVQVLKEDATVQFMTEAGYPLYFLTLLGIGKILGVVAVLIPKTPLLKEWAYAGFVFVTVGAGFTYISLGIWDDLYHIAFLFLLIGLSWYFRPATRKLAGGTVGNI